MAEPIQFHFDFSSPYSYIASEKIDALAAKYGRTVDWRPMLLGAVFPKTGTGPLVDIPLKGDYSRRDFARSARFLDVPFRLPSKFPVPTQHAGRAFYWLKDRDAAQAHAFAQAALRAYFRDDRDISELDAVLDIAAALGADRDRLAAALATPELKERFKRETAAAIELGMFGAPYIVVDGEPFWGADRLPQIERWLETGGF